MGVAAGIRTSASGAVFENVPGQVDRCPDLVRSRVRVSKCSNLSSTWFSRKSLQVAKTTIAHRIHLHEATQQLQRRRKNFHPPINPAATVIPFDHAPPLCRLACHGRGQGPGLKDDTQQCPHEGPSGPRAEPTPWSGVLRWSTGGWLNRGDALRSGWPL